MAKITGNINTQEIKLRKSFYKRGQRDYLKKLITELQERLGTRIIVTRNLNSVDSCIDALCKLIKNYKISHAPKEENFLLVGKKEISELKSEVKSLNEYIFKLKKEKEDLKIFNKKEKILSEENQNLKNEIKKYKASLKISIENKEYFKNLYKKEMLKSEKWWQIWK